MVIQVRQVRAKYGYQLLVTEEQGTNSVYPALIMLSVAEE